MSFSHKMERLIEDASNVHKLLPWIETEEDIINFMRRIPLDKVHMRNQLALYYFIRENDLLNDNEQKIEDEAREIIVVLPEVPYREIKERLGVLGSTPNRKEIVIRQLLVLKKDLGKMVSEIVNAKKRKTENIFDLQNNSDETNIKIKIRKIEGALKVVSSIKQEKVSTRPANDNTKEKCRKFLANVLELSRKEPKSTEINVRTLIQELIDNKVEPEDFCDKLERLLNASPQPCLVGFLKKSLPFLRHSLITQEVTIDGIRPPPPNVVVSLPGAIPIVRPGTIAASQVRIVAPGTTVVRPGQVPYRSSSEEESTSQSSSGSDINPIRSSYVDQNPIDFSNKFQSKIPVQQQPDSNDIQAFNRNSTEKNVNPYMPATCNLNNMEVSAKQNVTAVPEFDLVSFLQEITRVPNKKIKSVCKKHHVALNEKPSEGVLHQLLDHLMVPEVIQLDDTSNSGTSDTEEYFNNEMGNVQEPNRSNTASVKIEDVEPVTYQSLPNILPNPNATGIKIDDTEPIFANTVPDPVEHVELGTNNLQAVANEPNTAPRQPASKFFLRPSSLQTETNKRKLIDAPKFIPPSWNKPKSNNPDILPAFPQDVWAQINLAIATLEEERQAAEGGNDGDNQLEPSTSKDLDEKNKQVEAWLEEVSTSARSVKRNRRGVQNGERTSDVEKITEDEAIFEAIPSTSTASVTQLASIPSTSKEPDSSTEETMDTNKKVDEKLFLRLIEIFPQACPDYLKSVIRKYSSAEFSAIVSYILSVENVPQRPERVRSPPVDVDFEDQFDMVKALLPDADPQYLRMKCWDFANDVEGLNQFINDSRENSDYPTMKEYLRKQQLSAQTKQYTTEFNVEKFVELFPDPKNTFNDPKRIIKLDDYSQGYLVTFFQNRYDRLPIKTVRTILLRSNYRILASDNEMSRCVLANQVMKSRRKPTNLPEPGQNILFLQELAYLEHIKEIEAFIQSKKVKAEEERQYAKDNGLMQTCQCCYDDEVMPKDTFECPKGCKFCCDCIKKSCEIAFGEGMTDFKCLTDCTEEFTLQTLQNVLPPKMFSKVAQKKALAEVKAAGIEELVTCPFCDFASIPAENDKIFRCLNPECMKESCLQCKETNHLPLRCDEIEKDDDVKARIFVENQMTEALLRKCWKCGTNFFKEEGCNKMTCTCGAQMCYICRKPVTDYKHFNGIGGDKFELCPLYTNTNEDNERAVLQAAKAAKAQIDPAKLKVDPSADVKEHYKKRLAALPREPHLDLMNYVADGRRIQLGGRNVNRQQIGEVIFIDQPQVARAEEPNQLGVAPAAQAEVEVIFRDQPQVARAEPNQWEVAPAVQAGVEVMFRGQPQVARAEEPNQRGVALAAQAEVEVIFIDQPQVARAEGPNQLGVAPAAQAEVEVFAAIRLVQPKAATNENKRRAKDRRDEAYQKHINRLKRRK